MTALGRSGVMHSVTAHSLRAMLFTSADYGLRPVSTFGDADLPAWDDPDFGAQEPESRPCDGWIWHNAGQLAEGESWGGR